MLKSVDTQGSTSMGQFVVVNFIVQEDMSRCYKSQKNGGEGGQSAIQVFISIKWAWPVRTSTGWGVGIGSGRLALLAADRGQDQGGWEEGQGGQNSADTERFRANDQM